MRETIATLNGYVKFEIRKDIDISATFNAMVEISQPGMAATQERSVEHAPHTTLSLEPVRHTRETLDYWKAWINDPEIRTWMARSLPTTPEDINSWLYDATHDPYRFYFTIKADDKPIGFVSLRRDQAPDTTGEIGIAIGEKEYQSRGIGRVTIEAITAFAKNEVGLTSIRANIKPDNEKSIRLFTGQGFIETGSVTLDGEPFLKFEKTL